MNVLEECRVINPQTLIILQDHNDVHVRGEMLIVPQTTLNLAYVVPANICIKAPDWSVDVRNKQIHARFYEPSPSPSRSGKAPPDVALGKNHHGATRSRLQPS